MTLLIGVENELVDEVIEAIERCCESALPVSNGIFGLLGSGSSRERGQPDHANIFVFDVEYYEEI
jgi:uncharacterized protein YaaQ